MDINVWAVVAATVAQFIVGGVWYMGLFAKAWGDIHGFNSLSKEKQKEMAGKMGPFYGLQLIVTVATAIILAQFISLLPDRSPYVIALWAWAGFVVPTQVSAVVFGGTEGKFVVKKLAIMISASIACLMVAAAVIQAIQ